MYGPCQNHQKMFAGKRPVFKNSVTELKRASRFLSRWGFSCYLTMEVVSATLETIVLQGRCREKNPFCMTNSVATQ